MRVFITILLSTAIVRFIAGMRKEHTVSEIVSSLMLIGTEILGIVFVWKI